MKHCVHTQMHEDQQMVFQEDGRITFANLDEAQQMFQRAIHPNYMHGWTPRKNGGWELKIHAMNQPSYGRGHMLRFYFVPVNGEEGALSLDARWAQVRIDDAEDAEKDSGQLLMRSLLLQQEILNTLRRQQS